MTQTSLDRELRHAARHWREWAGADALAKTVTSVLNQSAFRGRNDDGNETTATWKASENTNWTQATDTVFRVRFEVEETAGGTTKGVNHYNGTDLCCQYNLNGGGWNNIPGDGTGSVVQLAASTNFAGPVTCTDQMTTSAKAFLSGPGCALCELSGVQNISGPIPTNQSVQCEYTLLIVGTGVNDGDTVQLRQMAQGVIALDSYGQTPSITVSKPASGTPTLDADPFPFELIADF